VSRRCGSTSLRGPPRGSRRGALHACDIAIVSPAWFAQPRITSSDGAGARDGLRGRSAGEGNAARSSVRSAAAPPRKRPDGRAHGIAYEASIIAASPLTLKLAPCQVPCRPPPVPSSPSMSSRLSAAAGLRQFNGGPLCAVALGSPYSQPWQLVTYAFLMAALRQIFFNMFALFMFGRALEYFWGSRRFTIFYLAASSQPPRTQLLTASLAGSTEATSAPQAVCLGSSWHFACIFRASASRSCSRPFPCPHGSS